MTAAVYFLSFKEAAANKKLLDHNLKEKRVQRLQFIDILLFYKEFAAAISPPIQIRKNER
jgi:hypothetical protein